MPTGRLESIRLRSQLLRGNPMGNSTLREALVYTPPGFSKGEKIPCVFWLPGFGSSPIRWSEKDFPMHRLVEYLILTEELPRLMMVCLDGSTRLGGSQYVDSTVNGPFATHIFREWVPRIEKDYGLEGPHVICGHSSGGYGSLHLGSLHPEIFSRVGCFGGDLHFELTHKAMLADLLNDLEGGKIKQGLKANLRAGISHYVLALGAAYSPNPGNKTWGMDLPIDLQTADILEGVWQKWLTFDPLHWPKARFARLGSLDRLYLGCGDHDQFQLHLGQKAFEARCQREKVPCKAELFATDHKLLHRQVEAGFKALLV